MHQSRLDFSTTEVILGGQALASIHPGILPLVVRIVIESICSLIPYYIGYNLVYVCERYTWIVAFLVMLFLWSLGGAKRYDLDAQKPFEDTRSDFAADVLSFGGISRVRFEAQTDTSFKLSLLGP